MTVSSLPAVSALTTSFRSLSLSIYSSLYPFISFVTPLVLLFIFQLIHRSPFATLLSQARPLTSRRYALLNNNQQKNEVWEGNVEFSETEHLPEVSDDHASGPRRILEIGCGSGVITLLLTHQYPELFN